MTTPDGERPRRLDFRKDAWALALLALFAVLWLTRFFDLLDEHRRDEGLLTEAAQRMVHGDVLYRDYETHASPAAVLPVYLMYRVVGVTVPAVKIPMIVQFVGLSWLLYLLGRRFAGPGPAFGTAFTLLGFNAMSWPILSHHWLSVAFLLLLAWALVRHEETGSPGLAALAGGAAGLAFLCVTLAGGAGALAGGGWLAASPGRRGPALAAFLGGLAAVLGGTGAVLAATGSLGAYLDQAVLSGGQHFLAYHQGFQPGVMLEPFRTVATVVQQDPWRLWTRLYLVVCQFYSMFALGALFMALASLVLLGDGLRAARGRLGRPEALLLGLGGLYGVPLLVYHPLPTYTNFVDPFLYLLALGLAAAVEREALGDPGRRLLRGGGAALLVGLNLFFPSVGLYADRQFVYPVPLAAGTLRSQSEEEAARFRAIQGWVDRTTPPGQPVFYSPLFDLAGLGPLVGRPGVAPCYNMVGRLGDPAGGMGERVRSSVERARPALLVLWKVNPEAPSDRPYADALLRLYGEITRGYRPVMQDDALLILVRADLVAPSR